MGDGHVGTSRGGWWWTDLFRTFQVALDPKKLLLAAAGIVCMWLGWWFLSLIVAGMRSEPQAPTAAVIESIKKGNSQLTDEQATRQAMESYMRARAQYLFFYRLAGRGNPEAPLDRAWEIPRGTFRIAPWNEDRGPNPFLLLTGRYREDGVHGRVHEQGRFWDWLITKQVPVLLEPLVKFLNPIGLMLSPNADFGTRFYLLLITLWTLIVWALFGGAITRIAVLQLAGKDGIGVRESLRFVMSRYAHYVAAPLVPLAFVAGITVIMMLFGLIHLIPFIGDLFDGVLWPVPMLLGFAQALLLVGLIGYPLMYPTISAEGSDTFDALSRSYNYVYQSPWAYLWAGAVAIAYGVLVVFFVGFMGSTVVYLTKWSLSQTPGTEYFANRRVDHLFIKAPASFDWHDLLVDQPELKNYAPRSVQADYIRDHIGWWNQLSATLVGMWLKLVLLFVVGFGYSYFFTSGTMIYLLMRQRVDDTEIDEVYTDDEFMDEPVMPPPSAPAAPQTQMVDAPTLRTPEPKPEA